MDSIIVKRCTTPVAHWLGSRSKGYGERTYAAEPVQRMAYVEGKIQLLKNEQGELVQSSLKLYIDKLFPVTTADKCTIDGQDYLVIAFQKFQGLRPDTGTTVVYV